MKRIVISGGPCAGKTTIISKLKEFQGDNAIYVTEGGTLILSGGFPAPPEEKFLGTEKFHTWQLHFQSAVYHTQMALEDLGFAQAQLEGKQQVICDRGTVDCIGYHPDGAEGFEEQLGATAEELYPRYDLVIFLESLAVGQPDLYGKHSNVHRYESAEVACDVNQRLHDVWKDHSNFHYIDSKLSLEDKTAQVLQLIKAL